MVLLRMGNFYGRAVAAVWHGASAARALLWLLVVGALLAPTSACTGQTTADDDGPVRRGWLIRAEPAAPLDALPQVVHIVVEGAGAGIEGALLLRGRVDSWRRPAAGGPRPDNHHARIHNKQWRTATGAWVIAPTKALAAGRRYTLAAADGTPLTELVVAPDQRTEMLELVWPPDGRFAAADAAPPGAEGTTAGASPLAVWCRGDGRALARERYTAAFAPLPGPANLVRGMGEPDAWNHCVHLAPPPATQPPPWLQPPPRVYDDAGEVAFGLPPTSLRAVAPLPVDERLSCEGEWVAVAAGCVRLSGDALLLQTPPQALLWLVRLQVAGRRSRRAASADEVVAVMRGDAMVLTLPSANQLTLTVETVNVAGRRQRQQLHIDRAAWHGGGDDVYG